MKSTLAYIVIVVLAAALLFAFWYSGETKKIALKNIQALTQQNAAFEKNLRDALAQKKDVEKKLEDLTLERDALNSQVAELEAKATALRGDYNRRLTILTQERERLAGDITRLTALVPREESRARFFKHIARKMHAVSSSKTAGTVGGKGGEPVELEPVTVTQKEKVSGKVLEVNKELGFIIADIGSDSGINMNDVLYIINDKTVIGKAIVEKVAPSYCAAKTLYRSVSDAVKINDTVTN